ncbi:MAG: transcriptional repressor [Phycisphaerales bacterium]|nr:transcriptional repressor [Phycisphaerales bacterium]
MERQTPQREAIRSLFTQDGDPMSPQEIMDRASEIVPTVSMATVYRTIRSLEELGEIVPVELPGEPPRYEMAGKDHHHHFMCESCGKAFEVDACPGNLSHMTPDGFRLTRHDITLYGTCKACNS